MKISLEQINDKKVNDEKIISFQEKRLLTKQ